MKENKFSTWFFCSTYSFKTCMEVCEKRRSMPGQFKKCQSCSLIEQKLRTDKRQPELTA